FILNKMNYLSNLVNYFIFFYEDDTILLYETYKYAPNVGNFFSISVLDDIDFNDTKYLCLYTEVSYIVYEQE
ncbi:hypothetical protein EBU95_15070, partial [bacterium]|nr:hypothetical protein [bacterium]